MPEFLCFTLNIPFTYNRKHIANVAYDKKHYLYKIIKSFIPKKTNYIDKLLVAVKKNNYNRVKKYISLVDLKKIIYRCKFTANADERILHLFKHLCIRLNKNFTNIDIIKTVIGTHNYDYNIYLIAKLKIRELYPLIKKLYVEIVEANNTELYMRLYNLNPIKITGEIFIQYMVINENYTMLETVDEKNYINIVAYAIFEKKQGIIDKYFDKCDHNKLFEIIASWGYIVDIDMCNKLLQLTNNLNCYALCQIKLDNLEFIKQFKFIKIPRVCYLANAVNIFKYLSSMDNIICNKTLKDDFIIYNNLIEYKIDIFTDTIDLIIKLNRLNFFKLYAGEIKNEINTEILEKLRLAGMREFLELLS